MNESLSPAPLQRFSASALFFVPCNHIASATFPKILTASFGFPDTFLPEILVLLVVVRLGFAAFLASF